MRFAVLPLVPPTSPALSLTLSSSESSVGLPLSSDQSSLPLFSSSPSGPPGPVVDLDAVPFSGNQVLVTWGRPPGFLSDISINYTVVVDRFQAGSPVTIVNETSSSTSLTVTENAGPDCVRHLFTVTALNEAGASQPSSVNESIPISEYSLPF